MFSSVTSTYSSLNICLTNTGFCQELKPPMTTLIKKTSKAQPHSRGMHHASLTEDQRSRNEKMAVVFLVAIDAIVKPCCQIIEVFNQTAAGISRTRKSKIFSDANVCIGQIICIHFGITRQVCFHFFPGGIILRNKLLFSQEAGLFSTKITNFKI